MASKIIVITSASEGIGAFLARNLAKQGHRLVLAARRNAELNAVAQECGAVAVVTDVTVRAQVEALRDRAIKEFGGVDVWVNNAGRGITKAALELNDEEIDAMVSANVKSALYGMQSIVPHFKERGSGHLINVSSFLGRVPMVSMRSAYSGAKAFLNAITASARMDLRKSHPQIHISLVMPGVVRTDFAKNALNGTPGWNGAMPFSQSPEEVAEAIANLIAQPVPEIYTNPTSAGTAQKYFEDVAAFEAGMALQGRP